MIAEIEFHGTFTALVTPLANEGRQVDLPALKSLVNNQIEAGVSGLVPCGTTGETPTLSADEQLEVIRCVKQTAAGRVPVIAGSGSNDTLKSIATSQAAVEAGADGVMIVMPYYNKPSQRGMCEHVAAIAASVPNTPVMIYNIPGRSGVDLDADATELICERRANVVALKDASGNIARCQELKRRLGDRLSVMCGDDALTLGMMSCGAAGVVSVSSNVAPAQVVRVTDALARGQFSVAQQVHFALLPLHALMFSEPNPSPAKAALELLGKMSSDVRLPLLPASTVTRAQLQQELQQLGILNKQAG